MGENGNRNAGELLSFRVDRETKQLSRDAEILQSWWINLKTHNKSDLSVLKRCNSINQVIMVPAFRKLHIALEREKGGGKINMAALAAVAGILSHVNHTTSQSFGYQMAAPKSGSTDPAITRLRFSRLLAISSRNDMSSPDDWSELMLTVIRIIRQLENRANIFDVANTVFWWNDKTKVLLVHGYYENL